MNDLKVREGTLKPALAPIQSEDLVTTSSRSRTLERPAPARAMPSGAAGSGARQGAQRRGPRR